MNTFTDRFFGHRVIDNALEIKNRLRQFIQALLRKHEHMEIPSRRSGAFDQLVSSTIRRCKREYHSDNIITKKLRCAKLLTHQTRNRAMVDRLDLVVVCIQQVSSGLWQTMKYVNNQAKPYINLHDKTEVTE